MLSKAQRILLIIGIVLLVIQLPWFFIVQSIVDKTQTKTVATVIRIESMGAGCTGSPSYKRQIDLTCDHSQREYPVYQYYDTSGARHEQDDRFFGEYKRNNPLRGLFWKDVGDTATAYYTKDKPKEVIFMAGPFAYTAWLVPLYVATPMLIASGALVVIQKLRK